MHRKLLSLVLLGVLATLVAWKGSLLLSGAKTALSLLPVEVQIAAGVVAVVFVLLLSGHLVFDVLVIILILWFVPSFEWRPLEEAVDAGVKMFSAADTSRATLYLRYIFVMNVISWLTYVFVFLGAFAIWRRIRNPFAGRAAR
jgi:hypothetical protein